MNPVVEKLVETVGERIALIIISQLVTPENIEKVINWGLDNLDRLAKETATTVDDAAVARLRECLTFPHTQAQ